MIDLTPLANAIITLIAALIAAFLIPWLRQKADAEKLGMLAFWVGTAVKAAEESFTGSEQGKAKRDYARQFLQDKGFDLDTEEAITLINGAVWEFINQFKRKQPNEGAE